MFKISILFDDGSTMTDVNSQCQLDDAKKLVQGYIGLSQKDPRGKTIYMKCAIVTDETNGSIVWQWP